MPCLLSVSAKKKHTEHTGVLTGLYKDVAHHSNVEFLLNLLPPLTSFSS